MPASTCRAVVFPAPFPPSTARHRPFSSVREKSLKTSGASLSYRKNRFFASNIFSPGSGGFAFSSLCPLGGSAAKKPLPSFIVKGRSARLPSAQAIFAGVGRAFERGACSSSKAAAISFGGKACFSLPCSIIPIRSAKGKSSSCRCSVRRMVCPSSRFSFSSIPIKFPAETGSSWEVGSSKISTLGFITMTDAKFSICL